MSAITIFSWINLLQSGLNPYICSRKPETDTRHVEICRQSYDKITIKTKTMNENKVKSEIPAVFVAGTTQMDGGNVIPGRERFSFVRGMNRVPMMNVVAVKNEICAELGVVNRTSFYKRLYGEIEPKVSEAQAIEQVFAKYGVTDVWGVENV